MRTIGANDIVPRRHRNDRGKKRKKYAGKPVKGKKRIYVRREGNKQLIILRIFWKVPMSRDGYNNWKPHLRSKVYKEVAKMQPPVRVFVSDINSKSKMEEFVATNYWEGKFVVMGVSHAKTKTHFKWVKICTIIVKETPEGNVGKMTENVRLSRYKWFYKG